jgi:hypothetical protein
MAEYIEREKMLEDLRLQFCKGCNNYSEIRCKSCSVDDVIGFIEDEPTADVVPVVRCKDCRHFLLGRLVCIYPHRYGKCSINDYCSYGERRCEE